MLALPALLAPAAGFAADKDCPASGSESPLELHRDWIMEGWERREADPAFVFATKMQRYYDLTHTEGVFYDNFAPGQTQLFTDSARYGANWEDLQNAARSVRHGLTSGHDQLLDGNVASTTLGFVGRLERLNGEVLAFDGRSQLGWTCRDGNWKIRQELNYAWVVEPETIADVLGKGELTP
ncbi:hypothetical protein FAA97_13290 [Peteryoungia ipomoeae]|uniref:SnoaL-like domain-containing protein n=1 Tax=Peteryoungia ipomoeae TaxID=1210932 RepID=A0A4S8NYC9_9HYPH|nr:hypothetical protein FAA97_13290 [Peteryoungia ipomoeae]